MLAFAQARVDRPPRERTAQGPRAGPAALDGISQPPAGFLIVQQLRPTFQDDLADDLGHRVQILERGHGDHVAQASKIGFRAAAILGRASAVAANADRIGLAVLRLHSVLNADLMPPGNVQVVLVDEPGSLAQLQCRKRHLGRSGGEFPRAVARGTETELIEVNALPPHRDLDGAVQLAQGAGVRDQHPPPYHRVDAEQPNLDLYDRFRIPRRQRRFSAGSGSLRGSRHPASLSPIAPAVAGTPQILMLSWPKAVATRPAGFSTSQSSIHSRHCGGAASGFT